MWVKRISQVNLRYNSNLDDGCEKCFLLENVKKRQRNKDRLFLCIMTSFYLNNNSHCSSFTDVTTLSFSNWPHFCGNSFLRCIKLIHSFHSLAVKRQFHRNKQWIRRQRTRISLINSGQTDFQPFYLRSLIRMYGAGSDHTA